jgi:hypothetical protein
MKTFLATTAIVAMTATGALAQGIGVGQEGRGYEARGLNMVEQLRGDWTTVNFTGSEDIARAVCGDTFVPTTNQQTLVEQGLEAPVVGIAQIDAIYTMGLENCNLQTLAEYPSQEYAFILFPPGSSYNELSDLGEGDRVLVDQVGSGTSLFWQTIVRIEQEHGDGSEWMNATPVNGATAFADGEAALGNIDAMIMVTSSDSTEVLNFLDNLDWELGELYDKDINDMQFGRGNLYDRETVSFDTAGWGSTRNDAYVVRSFWIANRDWATANQQDAARMVRIAQTVQ